MPTVISVRASLLIVTIVAPGCSDPTAPPPPPVLMAAAVPASNGQTGAAGTTLSSPLGVQVQSDDAPKSGVTVTWQASAGSIVPASSLTDAAGLATATWTLGTVPGAMTASATVAGAEGSPVAFSATALPPVRVTAAAVSGNDQTGVVGTVLFQALRVQALSDGAPKAGVTISWSTAAGSLAPMESVTDTAGIAETTWTLSKIAGVRTASASILGAPGSPVTFSATALAGPAAAMDALVGGGQTSPANRNDLSKLIGIVMDRFGNGVTGQRVTWTVESGPVAFLTRMDTTDGVGRTIALVEPTGAEGPAMVRAALPGGTLSVTFPLTILPREYDVILDRNVFRSVQNGTRGPAVDTIPFGETMTWTLDPFD